MDEIGVQWISADGERVLVDAGETSFIIPIVRP
jgi:hypothetical protein